MADNIVYVRPVQKAVTIVEQPVVVKVNSPTTLVAVRQTQNVVSVGSQDVKIVTIGVQGPPGPPGSEQPAQDATYTWNVDGTLDRIDYEDTTFKEYTWNVDGTLNTVFDGTVTKTYAWSVDGLLEGITAT